MKERMEQKFNKQNNSLDMKVNAPIPGSLNIELTSACNHNCIFCMYHSEYSQYKRQGYTMAYDEVIRLLEMAAKEGFGSHEIGFHMSGESMLHKDFAKCVKKAKDLGFSYVFTTTNGACVSEKQLKEIVDAGLDSIRFSINGYDRESYQYYHGHDDFDKVMRNMEFLKKYKEENKLRISTSTSTVLTRKSIEHRKEFEQLLSGLVDENVFIPVLSLNRVSEKMNEEHGFGNSSLKMDYTPCPAPFNSLYITSEGNVVACCDGSRYASMVIDNVNQGKTLTEIWNGEEFKRIRQSFLDGILPYEDCKGCALVNKNKEMII